MTLTKDEIVQLLQQEANRAVQDAASRLDRKEYTLDEGTLFTRVDIRTSQGRNARRTLAGLRYYLTGSSVNVMQWSSDERQ